MDREAKELAQQRAVLEAALAAERVDAQGHGYTPTPLTTPKPVQVNSAALSPFYMFCAQVLQVFKHRHERPTCLKQPGI